MDFKVSDAVRGNFISVFGERPESGSAADLMIWDSRLEGFAAAMGGKVAPVTDWQASAADSVIAVLERHPQFSAWWGPLSERLSVKIMGEIAGAIGEHSAAASEGLLALLTESADLFRYYETAHLEKAERISAGEGANNPAAMAAHADTLSKGLRNAEIASRIEAAISFAPGIAASKGLVADRERLS